MTLSELMSHLRAREVQLWADGDRLRYRAPDGSLTPALLAQLAEHKTEILRFMTMSEAGAPPLARASGDENLPVSFAQERLWFLEQLEPESSLYNLARAVKLDGALNVEALQKALDAIVARHETFRTRIDALDGRPAQTIQRAASIELPVIYCFDGPDGPDRSGIDRLIDAEARRPFDLSTGRMLRATLLRLDRDSHVLVVVLHHIAADGWSMGILLRELAALYRAFSANLPSPLSDLSIRYADFAIWQRRWLRGDVLEGQLAYWKTHLADLPVMELPSDRPRPRLPTYRGGRLYVVLRPHLLEALKELSRRRQVTLFMTLLAAFKTLLHRYTGQDDIVVGTPIAGRKRPEVEDLIGLFVNTLVLRTDLAGNPTFPELLDRVRQVTLDAYDHQELPFEKLVEELHPDRQLNRSPLFQVMFILQNAPGESFELPGVQARTIEIEGATAKFDLTFSIVERPDSLAAWLAYNTDLFDETTIERLWGHFETLLEAIVADSKKRLSDLPILNEAERRRLLVEWNDTYRDYPNDRCVHALFETQVERSADAVAVAFDHREWSYRDLNRRANRLARHLQTLGVGPEVRVGVCMERSPEMLAALLGILKAGGAYVPLDPNNPQQRLAFMLEDSRAPVLLTESRVMKELLEKKRSKGALSEVEGSRVEGNEFETLFAQLKVLCLDTHQEIIDRELDTNLDSGVTPKNLAYILYTSGSTGRPKGVMVEHGSLNNYLAWVNETLIPDAVALPAVSRLSFDASLKQLLSPLVRGQPAWIPSDETLNDPGALLRALTGSNVGLNCVPSLWATMLESASSAHDLKRLQNLRHLLLGGEHLPKDLVDRTLHALPGVALWNLYGPTEATANATAAKVTSSDAVTIGRPIANTQIYVLDSKLQPLPIGVVGELHIGGDGVARGYWNRPELTAEKFIPNPFSEKHGARLYKTGDLARRLPGGDTELIGRIDHQMKIRGFRIEPGEIETTLRGHALVRDAIVAVSREDTDHASITGLTNDRLVAYVLPQPRSLLTAAELRKLLQAKLPDYMVPSAFVFLDSLPLTPTGKIDRKALPSPDQAKSDLQETFVAPRTPTEELVAGIWAKLLRVEQLDIHDNFFDLGGHSLLATRLVSRLRDAFHVEISLRSVFEAPTVAGLAESVEAAYREEQGLPTFPLAALPREGDLPLSFAQERLWFLDQWEPGSPTYNMPAAFRLGGSIDVMALERSLNEMVRRHETLRTTFAKAEEQPIQIIAPRLTLSVPVVDLREFPDSERENRSRQIAADEAKRPFDLTRGPLLRSSLLRLGPQDHILLLVMHHIISDGWSMGVFLRELSTLYQAFSIGKPSPLPELPIQYADFVLWQRQSLRGEVLDKQLAYWSRQLADLSVVELPTDHPRSPVQTYRGARQSLAVSTTLTRALKSLSRDENGTLFMTLLAALNVLLHKYTGQNDIVVGAPIAGRTKPEIEGLIGFFLNSLVLRTDLSGDPSFRELLARVREAALGAYTHQDLPFEKLLAELQPERDLSRTPLFQVFFNMIDLGGNGTLDFAGVTVAPLEVHEPTSKFDLTLYAGEKDGALQLTLVYNPDLFEAATVARLLAHYHTLLEAIADNSQRSISSLSLLTEAERNQLAVRRNRVTPTNPFVPFSKESIEQSIAARFETQVKLFPDKTAVKTNEHHWTYIELNRKANQIAQTIIKYRGTAEERIGLLFDHGAPMIAGLLGALKAGKTYVPLDANYPTERLAYMLDDSQSSAVITDGRSAATAESITQGRLRLIQMDDTESAEWGCNLDLPISPDRLAYILYTSGSTGQPKGVVQNHRNALHFIRAYTNSLHLHADDRLTLLSSYSFDAAVMDIFGALLNGASLYPMDVREEIPSDLIDTMTEDKITIYHSTPTTFRYLFGGLTGKKDFATIRLVVLGGEEAQNKDVALFQRHFSPDAILANGLGPTESTVALQYFIGQAAAIPENHVPVGYPVEDTEVLLLNDAGRPADIYGEIGIRSSYVAVGYWRKPEMTEAAFLPDPDGGTRRIYRTGDMGRLLPDGAIGFLGRKDLQIKIRGFRVEPREVEAVLSQHSAVRTAIVTAQEESSGDRRLAAYVVPCGELSPSASELRNFLKEKLPDYMIPSVFMTLESLPLTPTGKIDRGRLPAPDPVRPEQDRRFIPPSTPTEKTIAGIWCHVLKLDQVGIHDNFFELGGHSLLATQVISRLREAFSVDLPLRRLFEHPTVTGLAAVILQSLIENSEADATAGILKRIESLSDEQTKLFLSDEDS